MPGKILFGRVRTNFYKPRRQSRNPGGWAHPLHPQAVGVSTICRGNFRFTTNGPKTKRFHLRQKERNGLVSFSQMSVWGDAQTFPLLLFFVFSFVCFLCCFMCFWCSFLCVFLCVLFVFCAFEFRKISFGKNLFSAVITSSYFDFGIIASKVWILSLIFPFDRGLWHFFSHFLKLWPNVCTSEIGMDNFLHRCAACLHDSRGGINIAKQAQESQKKKQKNVPLS